MAEETDQDLIDRAIAGDGHAFARLVERHYLAIYRTAFRWCGNREDAEDVAQDVCVKLGQAIRGFAGGSAFSTWLYRITLNAVRDMQRARARAGRNMAALAAMADSDPAAGTVTDTGAESAVAELWCAVRQLPDKQRDAVLLVYAEERSHAQAAEILGCAETTISWHVHAARKKLKGLLEEQMS